MFGSQHTYVLPTEAAAPTAASEAEKRVAAARNKQQQAIDVALNPEELEGLDAVTLKRKYEEQLQVELLLSFFFFCLYVFSRET